MRLAVLALLLAGCVPVAPPKDDCEAASRMFAHCGVSLPVLASPTCSGFTKAIARCVERTHGDCDALAALTSQLDVCAQQTNDGLPPLEDVPLPSTQPDGGVDFATEGAPDLAATDLGGSADLSPDLAPAPKWVGFAFSESAVSGQQHQHQTPVLDPGTYSFSTTGTGDVDLYVRIGLVPTTSLYDCRSISSGSTESCTLTLTSTARIYALVRAPAVSSTYTLVGTEL